MDLTGIFKPNAAVSGASDGAGALNKENMVPQQLYGLAADDGSAEDLAEWVHSRLDMLDLPVKHAELTPNVTRCIYQLLMERENLREKCDALITDCAEVQARTEFGCKENEILENQVLILKQDLGVTQVQLESVQNEQREVKARFLQEKAELEQRCFHLQALETQHLASLRKLEKDFGKLQDQLQKLMRSTDKKGASIQMSAATANNRARAAANVFVAERKEQLSVAALRDANSMILEENEKLRDLLGSIVEDFDALNERADRLEQQLNRAGGSDDSTPRSEDVDDVIVPPSPMVDLVNPRNKPLEWLRQHLDRNMFKLRQRILEKAKPSESSDAMMTPGVGIRDLDPTLSKMQSLAKRLRQAEQVVVEQDKLISAALLCQLPVTPGEGAADGKEVDDELKFAAKEQQEIVETKRRLEMELEYLEEQKTRLKLASRNLSASASAKKAALEKKYALEDLASTRQQLGIMFESPAKPTRERLSFGDLLPPATPGTMAALREAGLPLPNTSSAEPAF